MGLSNQRDAFSEIGENEEINSLLLSSTSPQAVLGDYGCNGQTRYLVQRC